MAKRKYYNNKHYVVDEKNQVVILNEDFHKELQTKDKWKSFKKLGGSSIPDVLETDKFKSQFNAFCHISKIKLPVLQQKYVRAGSLIEPIVFNALRNMFPKLDIKNYVAADYEYDYFKNKDDILGGVPDGFIPSTNTILEIKTAGDSKIDSWEKEVPVAYRKQAQLYAYLMGADKYSIIVTFLSEESGDYEHPENYPINDRKLKNYNFSVNPSEVQDDIDKIKAWYIKYTKSGISPKYNLSTDADLVEYLKCSNEKEWEDLLNKWKVQGKADQDAQA
ncbi:MAGa7180 family putative nuclease [Mycoplasma crocodyli]|uniref:YqaJ viral recombinase domain-containing protein n=1 Tax=Mycoplasma crocodyli (strain ATCC 51981 / MP145) TaxID=512564 RepID=D5E557_MYCCM|nr:YqaJ viral recombinase family protein [Mycoplasma crocodyli]ADE19898.1 hypothetical protein MCRO_0248 [Mycoplasma crocodyli MP145]